MLYSNHQTYRRRTIALPDRSLALVAFVERDDAPCYVGGTSIPRVFPCACCPFWLVAVFGALGGCAAVFVGRVCIRCKEIPLPCQEGVSGSGMSSYALVARFPSVDSQNSLPPSHNTQPFRRPYLLSTLLICAGVYATSARVSHFMVFSFMTWILHPAVTFGIGEGRVPLRVALVMCISLLDTKPAGVYCPGDIFADDLASDGSGLVCREDRAPTVLVAHALDDFLSTLDTAIELSSDGAD